MPIKTLSIYFLGTSFDAQDIEPYNARVRRGYKEFITQLYVMNHAHYLSLNSKNISRLTQSENILWHEHKSHAIPYQKINETTEHIKILVKGIGIHSGNLNGFSVIDSFKQGTGIGFSSRIKRVMEAIQQVILKYKTIDTINLFGFSRGGILAIEVANEIDKHVQNVSAINVFALDPVYGDPILGRFKKFKLENSKSKLKNYIGLYASNEQSTFFDASIPFDSNSFLKNKICHLFFLPCLHETLIGNTRQFNARSGKNSILNEEEGEVTKSIYKFVVELAILCSNDWGIPFHKNQSDNLFSISLQNLTEQILDIGHDQEIYFTMKRLAPKAQFVKNPYNLISRKYFFLMAET